MGPLYSTPTGFQDILGSTNSDLRTRAGELFRIGLLRGRLVNEKDGDRSSMPYGWALHQDNQHVHTRLGYLAYSIGKAMQRGAVSPAIERAFNILCTIFTLQFGFKFNNHYILSATLFSYLLDNFVPSEPRESQKWNRYLAAAMFCTLAGRNTESLVNSYLEGQHVKALFLRYKDSSIEELGPDELASKMDEGMSFSELSPEKSSLYWIGGNDRRGVYTRATREGSRLIRLFGEIERENISRNIVSPFKKMLKPTNGGTCILEQIDSTLKPFPAARNEWERLMRTLHEGVIEALRFVESIEVPNNRVFYGHDIAEANIEEDTLVVEIERENDMALPEPGDDIVLDGKRFTVQRIDESGDQLAISVNRLKSNN